MKKKISLENLFKKLKDFIKNGNFELAAEIANYYGYSRYAEKYYRLAEDITPYEREIFYKGEDAEKNLVKHIISEESFNSREKIKIFPNIRFYFTNKDYLKLTKN